MADLNVETYTLYPTTSYPLHILANKYTSPLGEPRDGYTLVLLHAAGMHKETWEIMLRRLFQLGHSDRHNGFRVRDVYSIECPNHGESAILNEDALKTFYGDSWPTREYSRAAHIFLTAGPTQGAKIDFSRRKLVAIGHSLGGPAIFCMRGMTPSLRFESIIAIEAGVSVKGNRACDIALSAMTAWNWMRRDTWMSRKAAFKDLASSHVFDLWDHRVLELYVKHALRPHPAAKYAEPLAFHGVTTCASKEAEAACYRSEDLVVASMTEYTAITRELPVHLIWGNKPSVLSHKLKELLRDPQKGRTPASVQYLDGVGHLAVQQKPDLIAEKIYDILTATTPMRAAL